MVHVDILIGALLLIVVCLFSACSEEMTGESEGDLSTIPYNPTPFQLLVPAGYPPLEVPEDNPLTIEGVELGRILFYEEKLSLDNSLSCSSCHLTSGSFTDNKATSPGVSGVNGQRSAMSLLDMAFATNGLFWDGRVHTLEEQALLPVEDPVEMEETWDNVIKKLVDTDEYPGLFRKAFGIESVNEITPVLVTKAISQFERTLVSSGMSKYDQVVNGTAVFSDDELAGFEMFFDLNPALPDAECGHCHNAPLFTTHEYFNNGLDEAPTLNDFNDPGFGAISGLVIDNGKFRVPTLRNIEFSAPYMHDGRFMTLLEVVDHYNSGGKTSPNKDELIRPLGLTPVQIDQLIAFIQTLRDEAFIIDPAYQDPN